jgi:hypothetical protein
MMTNWLAAKMQQFSPVSDAGLDELGDNFDFALSAEIADWLYAKNAAGHQAKIAHAGAMLRFDLDEHEQAIA